MGKRVVVVDDNQDMVDTLSALLRLEGHEIKGCYDALNLLTCVREFDPDAVVLDLAMPRKSGMDAAREIRASIPGDRPILIALTAQRGLETKDIAFMIGFDYYLNKTADPNALSRLLASI